MVQWVKNLSSNAWDAGSIPALGTKIPCVLRELSPHTAMKSPRAETKTHRQK